MYGLEGVFQFIRMAGMDADMNCFQAGRGLIGNLADKHCSWLRRPDDPLSLTKPTGRLIPARPVFFYRCQNLADALAGLGRETDCLHRTHLCTTREADILVFHRPRATWSWRQWRKRTAPASGRLFVAEVDDLVFDPSMAVHSPAVRNRHKTLRGTRRLFTGNHAALASFKRISTSTEPLAEHLMRCFPGVEAEVFPTLWSKAFGPENLHFIDYDKVSTSPAALPPLLKMRALFTQCRVVTMPRVHHSVVSIDAEQLAADVAQ